MTSLKEIAGHFDIRGTVKEIAPLGNGLINDTYKIVTEGNGPDYVLQHINNAIFTDVDLLQNNIRAVTEHIRAKLIAAGETDIDRKTLRFIPVKGEEKTWYFDGEKYWRVSVFIPDAYTYEAVNPEYSYYAGKAFGHFEAMLSDLNEPLGETIPDFHNMELRLRQLVEAVEKNAADRLDGPQGEELHAILQDMDKYGVQMCLAEQLYREGKLPKRVCHCDTKVNNMLFDKDGKVLCVIDLDTVMPSFVFSDYGDFLRIGACTAPEDEPDLDKVGFDMDIFRAFTKGYIESAKEFLTPVEIEHLPYAAALFPFMQAVRFFADYLNGDTYYRIRYPEHNLVRTRAQLKLFHCVLDKTPEMHAYIASLL